jgi:DNA-binding MarR family transcriptional regulator
VGTFPVLVRQGSEVTTTTDRELAHLLTEVQGSIARRLAVVLRGQGCSVEEWWVLNAISEDGGRPMNEIGDFAMLPKPSLTKLVDGMVGQNLVYRRGDVQDRRRVLLFLTVRGKKKLTAAKAAVADEEACLAELLGAEHLEGLRAVLGRLAESLR